MAKSLFVNELSSEVLALYEKKINNKVIIYQSSVTEYADSTLFIGKVENEKFLFIVSYKSNPEILNSFEGEVINLESLKYSIKKCCLDHNNANAVQEIFPFTNPIKIGLCNSFGFGDRIGLANAAHIRSLEGSDFKPILAQQSIRELTRTQRTPEQVMDAAVWAVFQEGYEGGFGADADHLKTTDDIDLMINAGFTMFTFDPGDHVINEADYMSISELESHLQKINWETLKDSINDVVSRYNNNKLIVDEQFSITPSYEQVLKAVIKYGNAIAHIKSLYDHIKNNHFSKSAEVEISVDETESVTTPFEHYFIASGLKRLEVEFISLAPRFIGEFEKGIDYKGDLEQFRIEYMKHLKISELFGSYKISLHSGSDKFSVYKVIGQLNKGFTHVKTAGTSYLEALKVVAATDPLLFREILDFARNEYAKEKETYHVSARLENVEPSGYYNDEELISLFTQNDARQVMHVTFGKTLTETDQKGNSIFKDKIYKCLVENEDSHYEFLIDHFKNHLSPFQQ